MTMGTEDFFAPAGPAHGFVTGPALDYITSLAPGSVAGPALDSVTGPAPGVVASRVAHVVIDPIKSNYFYGKQVTAEDFTSSKLYMKRTIWIRAFCLVKQARHRTTCWVFRIIHEESR